MGLSIIRWEGRISFSIRVGAILLVVALEVRGVVAAPVTDVSHLRRSRFFLRLFPGLPAWANFA